MPNYMPSQDQYVGNPTAQRLTNALGGAPNQGLIQGQQQAPTYNQMAISKMLQSKQNPNSEDNMKAAEAAGGESIKSPYQNFIDFAKKRGNQ